MAVIRLGSIVSDIRGSIGEETYSRGQGGLYVKARSGPTGEPTAKQLASTAATTALSQAWSATLTEAQRESWQTYAKQFPRPNQWGQPSLKNGFTRFIAVNFPQYVQSSAVAFRTAPVQPPFTPPVFSFTATTAPDKFIIPAPLVNICNGSHVLWLYIYVGTEQNVGRNYYRTPYTSLYYTTRAYSIWQYFPLTISVVPAVYTTGKKIWLRMRIQCSECGHISTPAQASAIFDA